MKKNKQLSFTITLTLKSGVVRKHKLKDYPDKINEAMAAVDESWYQGRVGFVQVGTHWYRTDEIAHYSLKPSRWWL